ncbi:MAG: proline dehydrogenase family protein, partial [Gemmatimonadetes bacterium]|nr:proline dehydrogenase family protein [Gemmatimonadota bacterium]
MRLSTSGIKSVLALLGENVTEADEADEVTRHYQGVLKEIAARDLDAEISVKPTQLGIDVGSDVVATNLERILTVAEEHGRFVWIDMEGSSYVDRTLDLYRAVRSRHQDTGVCLQAYLYRTAEDLAALLPINPSIRLVKGAYAESAEVAFPRKRDVDENYLQLAQTLLDEVRGGGVRAAFATHDEGLIRRIQEEAAHRGMTLNDVEFQMLYGIGTTKQAELAAQGHDLVVDFRIAPAARGRAAEGRPGAEREDRQGSLVGAAPFCDFYLEHHRSGRCQLPESRCIEIEG